MTNDCRKTGLYIKLYKNIIITRIVYHSLVTFESVFTENSHYLSAHALYVKN